MRLIDPNADEGTGGALLPGAGPAADVGAGEDRDIFLSTVAPSRRDWLLAITIALFSLVVFAAVAPFAKVQLPVVPAFIPAYESALLIGDLITGVLLLGQFAILRSRALLVLAGGYLFSGLMAVPHALTFPGVFAPTGLLGARPQTTSWLYISWHIIFPLIVIAYALLKEGPRDSGSGDSRAVVNPRAAIIGTVVAVPCAVAALTLAAIVAEPFLPAILVGIHYTPTAIFSLLFCGATTLLSLVVLWVRRPYSILDLWLMVVMCAWLFDVGLSAAFNNGRYDLGFYAGRAYVLLGASFVLAAMLVEAMRLYARLAAAARRMSDYAAELEEGVRARTIELQRSNEALRGREEQLKRAQHLARVGSELRDLRTGQSEWSAASYAIFGVEPDAFVPTDENVLNLVHADDRALVVAGRTSLAAGICPDPFEHRIIRPDGELRHLYREWELLHDDAGRPIQLLGTLQDITERKEAEQKIQAQMERAEALLESAPDPVVIVDRGGRILIVNARTETAFAYPRAELLGQPIEMLIPEGLRAGRDLSARRRDDSEFAVDVSLSPLTVAAPGGSLVISTIRDVTERRQTEQQLRQAQKMEAIGNLTGGMAHDFNNLLSIIISNLDLLREFRSDDEEADELARDALDAALRGADLTRRLLAFARQQPLQAKRIDLNDLVGSITRLLSRTLGEQIEISLDLAADAWPTVVDPAQLEASLTNLATNARDAMPRGGKLIIVTGNRVLDTDYAELHAEVTPGDYVMLEVSDTGTGMPAAVRERIFDPFYTTKERGKGTGLGLSMVFGFLKQSGGHINVYSEVGVGTTFRLYLPRAVAEQAADSDATAPAAQLARGRGETVLVVEDNVALRRIVLRQLREFGYGVLEAESAATAVNVMEQNDVDLMLTDIVMPGGTDGVELAGEVRERWPQVRVVFTSGFPENALNGSGRKLASGMRLLSKPYRREELAGVVRATLDA